MSLQHIQKNSPRLLPKPAKFGKNPPNGYRVIRKTKCGAGGAGGAGGAAGAGGAGGAGSSPIHKQASLAGRLILCVTMFYKTAFYYNVFRRRLKSHNIKMVKVSYILHYKGIFFPKFNKLSKFFPVVCFVTIL